MITSIHPTQATKCCNSLNVSWNAFWRGCTHQISHGFAGGNVPAFLDSNEEAKGFRGERTGNGNITANKITGTSQLWELEIYSPLSNIPKFIGQPIDTTKDGIARWILLSAVVEKIGVKVRSSDVALDSFSNLATSREALRNLNTPEYIDFSSCKRTEILFPTCTSTVWGKIVSAGYKWKRFAKCHWRSKRFGSPGDRKPFAEHATAFARFQRLIVTLPIQLLVFYLYMELLFVWC